MATQHACAFPDECCTTCERDAEALTPGEQYAAYAEYVAEAEALALDDFQRQVLDLSEPDANGNVCARDCPATLHYTPGTDCASNDQRD